MPDRAPVVARSGRSDVAPVLPGFPSRGGRSSPRLRRALACLLFLLGVHAISTGYTYFSTTWPWPFRQSPSANEILTRKWRDPAYLGTNPTVGPRGSPFRFTEITKPAGIDFVQFSGMTDAKHLPTAYGFGVAIFDYDNDGRLDLYFATATRLPLGTMRTGPNRLYRNLGGERFRDMTRASGLDFAGFCHGIVTGDIDNDGDQDVFLCNYGANVLYLNRGDGTFQDITQAAGVAEPGWSTAGAFLDFDNDGFLDLYVARYGHWRLPDNDQFCAAPNDWQKKGAPAVRVYCSPKSVRPARHLLYRNNGNRTFTDVTERAGVGRTDGRGLGVVAADLNNDLKIDLYVANDMCPNFVFLNQGDGTFHDATESSGAGYDASGQTRAGMGVDAEDVNRDGLPDLFVTNFWNEPNSLFMNLGNGLFHEQTATSGMMHDSLAWVGWGCGLIDFDNDGWPDCFVANGHLDDNLELAGITTPYAEPALLHRNLYGRRFALETRGAGSYFEQSHVGRGVAFGDLDNDGDVDLVINHKDGPPAVLRNDTPSGNHWIRLSLLGTKSNRDAIGARIEVETNGNGLPLVRQRKGGASLGSSHDPRLLVGLNAAETVRRLTVRWPSGQVDRHENLAADQGYICREGGTKPEPMPAVVSRIQPDGRQQQEHP